MTDVGWISLGGFLLTAAVAIVGLTLGVKRFSEQVAEKFAEQLENMKREFVQMEVAYERRNSQMETGLRAKITDVEFYIRDNYVGQPIFNKMIDMAAANNENQFRALTEQVGRINDKLDTMQDRYRSA